MSKCDICAKTAYPLESVNAIEKTFHKTCFKCTEPSIFLIYGGFAQGTKKQCQLTSPPSSTGSVCLTTLNLKNYKGLEGKIYCYTHVPVSRSSVGGDGVAVTSALSTFPSISVSTIARPSSFALLKRKGMDVSSHVLLTWNRRPQGRG
jgi:hypothetical protein